MNCSKNRQNNTTTSALDPNRGSKASTTLNGKGKMSRLHLCGSLVAGFVFFAGAHGQAYNTGNGGSLGSSDPNWNVTNSTLFGSSVVSATVIDPSLDDSYVAYAPNSHPSDPNPSWWDSFSASGVGSDGDAPGGPYWYSTTVHFGSGGILGGQLWSDNDVTDIKVDSNAFGVGGTSFYSSAWTSGHPGYDTQAWFTTPGGTGFSIPTQFTGDHLVAFEITNPEGATGFRAQFNLQPAPEPATIAALGVGALGFLRRRSKRT